MKRVISVVCMLCVLCVSLLSVVQAESDSIVITYGVVCYVDALSDIITVLDTEGQLWTLLNNYQQTYDIGDMLVMTIYTGHDTGYQDDEVLSLVYLTHLDREGLIQYIDTVSGNVI